MTTNTFEGLNNAQTNSDQLIWFVMCDQKRRNATEPAYKMLERIGFEVFTPLTRKVVGRGKNKKVVEIPFIVDLLFVHSTREKLDPVEERTPTLHYRFKKGGAYREALVVREDDMNRFIHAIQNTEIKEFFGIDEVPKEIIGSKAIIHGGPLDGYNVTLRKLRGSYKKHIFVELPGLACTELELKVFDSIEVVK